MSRGQMNDLLSEIHSYEELTQNKQNNIRALEAEESIKLAKIRKSKENLAKITEKSN